MSIAIRITQNIKDKNPHNWVQNVDAGTIIIRGGYPNRFFKTENVVGGYAGRTDLHSIDGWRPFTPTVFDPLTQRENRNNIVKKPDGAPLIDVTHYTYKIIDLTAQEIIDLADEIEEQEARDKQDAHIFAGQDLFEKSYRKIWRRNNKLDNTATNYLSQSNSRKLMRWFAPSYTFLKLGDWNEARKSIDSIITDNQTELDATAGMINTATWLQGLIQDYFDNQYDL